jgi:hypothetical protein
MKRCPFSSHRANPVVILPNLNAGGREPDIFLSAGVLENDEVIRA